MEEAVRIRNPAATLLFMVGINFFGIFVVTVPVIILTSAALPNQPDLLIPVWVATMVLLAAPAFRISIELRPGRIVNHTYFRRWDVAACDVERLVPVGYGFLYAMPNGTGSMGMVLRGRKRPILVPASMSWSWRFGSRPSKHATRLAEAINDWADANGVSSTVTADHLAGRR